MRWVYFPLHPETPQEGKSLEALFAGRNLDLEAMYLNMKALMDEEDLPYGRRTHTYNSRLAQEIAKWAETQSDGERLHDLLYEAYFVNGENIGDPQVLLNLVAAAGLDRQVAAVVIQERTFAAAIDADWMLAREYGVTGVPTFVAGGRGVVGAQEYATLAKLVTLGGAREQTTN